MDAFDFNNIYRCKECPFITTDSWVCELHKKIRESYQVLYRNKHIICYISYVTYVHIIFVHGRVSRAGIQINIWINILISAISISIWKISEQYIGNILLISKSSSLSRIWKRRFFTKIWALKFFARLNLLYWFSNILLRNIFISQYIIYYILLEQYQYGFWYRSNININIENLIDLYPWSRA